LKTPTILEYLMDVLELSIISISIIISLCHGAMAPDKQKCNKIKFNPERAELETQE
jgi:hypothetical protein